jgi:hypothetical protein
VQDRNAHIRLKKDHHHQQYLNLKEQRLTQQISDTVQAAAEAAATTSSSRSPLLNAPLSVQTNDVDHDDLPSSRSMEIDGDQAFDTYSDEEGSIASELDELVEETEDEDVITQAMKAALGDDFESHLEVFDFLPAPDLDNIAEGEADPALSTAAHPTLRRVLVDDDADTREYQWHETGGRVYSQEPTAHARWKLLFGGDGHSGSAYSPFSSRLDWEMAQWAVKEKIPQKSFDRLLKIPKVIYYILLRKH